MVRWIDRHSVLVLAVVAISGCSQPDSPPQAASAATGDSEPATSAVETPASAPTVTSRGTGISFSDVTDQTGISFVNRNGEEAGHYSIVESLGGGVGVIDVDRDGHDDVLLPGGGTLTETAVPVGAACGLFLNRGAWRFTDISLVAGLVIPRHYSHGIACADFDNDGFSDAVVTGYGGLQLFHNLGDGTFAEISTTSGLTDELWSSSAAWGDLTGDGVLDLYVCHYVNWRPDNHPYCQGPGEGQREVCPPRDFTALPDVLYVGSADGTFRDATAEFQLRDDGKGLGVLIADLDNDRDLDIYVTNDTVPNVLYRNESGRTFADTSLVSGASLNARGVPDGSMGVQLLDYNQDGQFDIWVANYERETSALYEGQGKLLFRHVSQRSGLTAVGASFVGWGTLCFDADHDGDEDVFVSNGHVIRYPRAAPLRQAPLFFENENGKRFRDIAALAGDYMSTPHMARGSAFADFDSDGDLDLAVMHTNEETALLQNNCNQTNSLNIELTGRTSSRDAIGTVVEVVTRNGAMIRQHIGGGSYASSSSQRLHFGLGDQDVVEAINITWPSGETQHFQDIPANSHLGIVESRTPVILNQE